MNKISQIQQIPITFGGSVPLPIAQVPSNFIKKQNRGVAQFGMCEASRLKRRLGGSVPSPIAQVPSNFIKKQNRGVAQFGSALGSGPRGRRFESCHSDQCEDHKKQSFFQQNEGWFFEKLRQSPFYGWLRKDTNLIWEEKCIELSILRCRVGILFAGFCVLVFLTKQERIRRTTE